MSDQPLDRHAGYDKNRLFLISILALLTTALIASIRSGAVTDLQATYYDPVDLLHAKERIGWALSLAGIGFAVAIFVGSPLLDVIGMGRGLALASLLHIGGTLATIFLHPSANPDLGLWICMIAVGLGSGLVECVINPLAATLYPDEKVHKLNVLHAWWPGGLVIGGLLSYFLTRPGMAVSWQIRMALPIATAIVYGIMAIGAKFPPTERRAAGVSGADMWKQALNPLFLLLLVCMLGTAASEIAPGQWVDSMLTRVVGFQAILLLVYISAIMFVMRHFAGHLAHKLSPIGLMCVSCLLATIGLYLLSTANSVVVALLAATVWGVGVCFMWPTMLGIASERFPKGGALLVGLVGFAGNLAIFFVVPAMGRIFDSAKNAAAAATGTSFELLNSATDAASRAKLNHVLASASEPAFKSVAIMPAIAFVIFGAWWFYDKSRGGYRAERLQTDFDHAVAAQAEADRTAKI